MSQPEEPEEIVIRHVSGSTTGARAVAYYIMGHLQNLDAEFSVIVRQRSFRIVQIDRTGIETFITNILAPGQATKVIKNLAEREAERVEGKVKELDGLFTIMSGSILICSFKIVDSDYVCKVG